MITKHAQRQWCWREARTEGRQCNQNTFAINYRRKTTDAYKTNSHKRKSQIHDAQPNRSGNNCRYVLLSSAPGLDRKSVRHRTYAETYDPLETTKTTQTKWGNIHRLHRHIKKHRINIHTDVQTKTTAMQHKWIHINEAQHVRSLSNRLDAYSRLHTN